MFSEERIIVNDIKKKSKKDTIMKAVLTNAVYILLGAFLGLGVIWPFNAMSDSKAINSIAVVAVFIPSMVFSYVFHIVAHEFGHVILGKLTGYEFYSYRIFSFMFVKNEGKWKMQKYSIPGTLGQAIMLPPEKKNGTFPWFWYNVGGCLMNITLSLIALMLYFFIPRLSFVIGIILLTFSVFGFLLGLSNLIPFNGFLASNDGNNILAIYKDEIAKDCFYRQLYLAGELMRNKSYKEMPKEFFQLPKEANLRYALVLSIKTFELEYNYEIEDYDAAVKLLNELNQVEGLPKFMQWGIDLERLFIECMQGPREEIVEKLCTKELLEFLKQGKTMLDIQRVNVAYEALYHKDRESATKSYHKALQLVEQYPLKGKVNIEKRFLEMIMNKMKEDNRLNLET